jgi:hypothetical protein
LVSYIFSLDLRLEKFIYNNKKLSTNSLLILTLRQKDVDNHSVFLLSKIYLEMKRLLTSLAALVLVAQTVLPNFLYATGEISNGTDVSSTPTGIETPSNPASGDDRQVVIDGELPSDQPVVQPQCEAELIRDIEEGECVEEIILDEGDDVVPYEPESGAEEIIVSEEDKS